MKVFLVVLISCLLTLPVHSQEDGMNRDTGSFLDTRDKKMYRSVKIGTQVWMADNLNYAVSTGSSCYNLDTAFCKTYGRLYEWSAALKACPPGWHLPTGAEWNILSEYLGDQAGEKLKEPGTLHWEGPDAVVRGDSRFDALPAGSKNVDPSDRPNHMGLNQRAYFWTASTGTPAGKGSARYLDYLDDVIHPYEEWKIFGFSVRCLRDK
jgi:uncharacterized protein (TIGR02145 family)